jgi:hypothetical protein
MDRGFRPFATLRSSAAQQFVDTVRWRTFKVAKAGVNLKSIVDHTRADALWAGHFAPRDKLLKRCPPYSDIASCFVGAQTARGEIDDDALASHNETSRRTLLSMTMR